jgi:hypothetical protein
MAMMGAFRAGIFVLVGCSYDPASNPAQPDASPDTTVATDAPGDAGPPWLHPWTHRKSITLKASQIEAPNDTVLTDFPVVVSVIDAQLADAALASGTDIVFTGDDKTTVLAREIERFDPIADALVAWVKVPALSATTDTTIYVYYGNPSPPDGNAEAVWTADFLGVWHLQQDPGPGNADDIRDATSNNRDGTALANMVTANLVPAQVGLGLLLDGTEDFINLDHPLDVGNQFTISMWARWDGKGNINTLFADANAGRDSAGMRMFVNTANQTDRRLVFEAGNGNMNSGQTAETVDNVVTAGTFAHLAAVVDRTNGRAELFVDGVKRTGDNTVSTDFRTASNDFEFGRMENNVLFFEGVIDELEIAAVQRPVEWLVTSFNNQSDPAAFHELGTEELEP